MKPWSRRLGLDPVLKNPGPVTTYPFPLLLSLNDSASAGLKVTLSAGQTVGGQQTLSLLTDDIQGLKDVLAECKRLKDISGTCTSDSQRVLPTMIR